MAKPITGILRDYVSKVRTFHGTDVRGEKRAFVDAITKELLEIADVIDAKSERLCELEEVVNDFLGDLPCDDCALRRDCDDNNRVSCHELSFHAMSSMRRLVSRSEAE